MVRRVARRKAQLPDRVQAHLDTLRSLPGGGPVVGLPAFRRVLVLAAHPDDEVIGCGGLIALLTAAGAEVHVAYATDGEATRGGVGSSDEVARVRRAEAIEACRVLGVDAPRFLGHPDGALAANGAALAADVAALIAEFRPEVVLAPWHLDGHEDHRALAAAVPAEETHWGYEVWTPLPPTWVVDVTAVQHLKEQALACYRTTPFDATAMLGLGRYRAVHGLQGRGHAEAFFTTPRR